MLAQEGAVPPLTSQEVRIARGLSVEMASLISMV